MVRLDCWASREWMCVWVGNGWLMEDVRDRYYGGSQWRVAARKPKGLTCIIPWEGKHLSVSILLPLLISNSFQV
jgi:hypothetical protein